MALLTVQETGHEKTNPILCPSGSPFLPGEGIVFAGSDASGIYISEETAGTVLVEMKGGVPLTTDTLTGTQSGETRAPPLTFGDVALDWTASTGSDTFPCAPNETALFVDNVTATDQMIRIIAQRADPDGQFKDWYRLLVSASVYRFAGFDQRFIGNDGLVTVESDLTGGGNTLYAVVRTPKVFA